MGDGQDLERCLDALYVALRDGAAVDRQAAFGIAMNELEYFPLHVEARELAEASVTDGDEARLASAARAFLNAYGYVPGFELAPERFARLERALDAVLADMSATGLAGKVRLVRPDLKAVARGEDLSRRTRSAPRGASPGTYRITSASPRSPRSTALP
jgi:hypothetical protein